jgi:phosphate transport system substrate-binding protein
MFKVTRSFAAALAMSAVAAGSLAVGVKPAQAQTLTGAGSSFINPIMTQWVATYKQATGVSINYQPIGSGGGISALISKTVNFAGSDAPMNAQEMADAKGPVVHLPAVIGAVVIGYNLPGVSTGLHLTGPVIADIFMGKITSWNAPQIAKLNPGVRLPGGKIFVAHRSDGSGTTYIVTDYLAKVSPEWKSRIGVGKSVAWPVGLGGKGSAGLAGLLSTRPNSIGYVELAYALQNHIEFATVENAKGKWVVPTAESSSAAAEGVKLPPDMRASLTNSSNPDAYPITGFTWLIVRKNTTEADQLKRFLHWMITSGQSFTKQLSYASLPTSLRQREAQMINGIQ